MQLKVRTKKEKKVIVASRVSNEVYMKLKKNKINISATIEEALQELTKKLV